MSTKYKRARKQIRQKRSDVLEDDLVSCIWYMRWRKSIVSDELFCEKGAAPTKKLQ